MSTEAIRIALDAKLLQLPWVTDWKKQIAFEDKPFAPEFDKSYLATHLMLNAPVDLDLAGRDAELRGIYQVTVKVQEGKGSVGAASIADQVALHFKPVQEFPAGARKVTIYKSPAIASGYHDESGRYCIPVSIMWNSLN